VLPTLLLTAALIKEVERKVQQRQHTNIKLH
jgi:hypothetical protein